MESTEEGCVRTLFSETEGEVCVMYAYVHMIHFCLSTFYQPVHECISSPSAAEVQ